MNFIQKKPSGRNRTRISGTYGTDAFYRGEIDFDRVLTKDGSLGFRLPLYYEDSDGTRGGDLMHSNKFGIGPAFGWKIGSRTDLHLTTAYFHRPDELQVEVASGGFQCQAVFGLEGPGWILSDFAERWADTRKREDLLRVARALEREVSIVGLSAHLLAVGTKE